MTEPLKLCRDCKWCRHPDSAQSTCLHDTALAPVVNIVTGAEGQPALYCVNMRLAMGAVCGVEARLFEARQ